MREDIVDELREAARVVHKKISEILGEDPDYNIETSVPWRGADEITSLRIALKEAEASRGDLIEECARHLRNKAEMDDMAMCKPGAVTVSPRTVSWREAADELRTLKSSAATPKPQKNDCQGEDPITILKEALRQANSYIDSTHLMPGNSYKEIKAVIRDALECNRDAS